MTEGRRLSRAIAVALAIAERLVDEALAPASGRALVQPGALAMNRCSPFGVALAIDDLRPHTHLPIYPSEHWTIDAVRRRVSQNESWL